jgi:hypothetical protein
VLDAVVDAVPEAPVLRLAVEVLACALDPPLAEPAEPVEPPDPLAWVDAEAVADPDAPRPASAPDPQFEPEPEHPAKSTRVAKARTHPKRDRSHRPSRE